MTKEEAIIQLEYRKDFATPDQIEALDMAISALSNKGDSVSRQAVLSTLENADKFLDEERTVDNYKELLTECIKVLPSAENKGGWIPVSERLPEKNMPCLVAVGKFNLTQMAIYSDLMGIIDHKIFYQGDVGCDSFVDITEYVKAWQPLPEPYKKGE